MAFGRATNRRLPRNLISEETAYKARAWALWTLIVVAAVSGIAGLLRPQPRPVVSDTSGVTDRQVDGRWPFYDGYTLKEVVTALRAQSPPIDTTPIIEEALRLGWNDVPDW